MKNLGYDSWLFFPNDGMVLAERELQVYECERVVDA